MANNTTKEATLYKATIWCKNIKVKETGVTFPKTLIRVLNNTFECTIEKNTLKRLQREFNEYPIEVTFSSEQYFIKKEKTTKKDGTPFTRQYLVLLDYMSAEQGTFEKYSIEDAIEDRVE